MAHRTENNAWMSVPQFGDWDQKGTAPTNYSVVFSRARANKKQQKIDIKRSIGNEQELIAAASSSPRQQKVEEDSVTKRKKFLTYINCCIRP